MRTRTKLATTTALVAGALLFGTTAASAAVTFDAETGTGFVGKGDVQTAFAWNNKALQDNASGVTFSYSSTDTYAATCVFVTGEGTRGEQTHTLNIPRTATVDATVAYDARTARQITGFTLEGFTSTVASGNVPVVGGVCPGAGTNGAYTAVELVSSGDGALVVTHGTTSVELAY